VSTRMMPSSSTGVACACSGELTKGGEAGATGPPTRASLPVCRVRPVLVEGMGGCCWPSMGLERGEGVRGGLEEEVRRWKRLPDALKVGMSRDRRRPRAPAAVLVVEDDDEEEEGVGMGMGMCSSAGCSRRDMVTQGEGGWSSDNGGGEEDGRGKKEGRGRKDGSGEGKARG
jgi:hypothetical protein